MPTKTKRVAYASITQEETALLDQLPFEERWLYIKLKWLANFKTGEVGRFRKRILTYEGIGDMISVPASQGRAAKAISGGDVKRMLDRLHTAGLISAHAKTKDEGVHFTMLLSPIRLQATEEKLQISAPTQKPANPDGTTVCADLDPAISVLMSKGHNNTFSGNDRAGGTPAPRRRHGSSPPPASPKFSPNDDAPPNLTIELIRRIIADNFLFDLMYANTPQTEQFFASWVKREISVDEIQLAMDQVIKNDETQTAGAIDKHINTKRNERRIYRKPNSARGHAVI